MALKFQEIPPTKHSVFGLAEASPISNRTLQIRGHVLCSFLIIHIEELPTHFYHLLYNIFWDPMVHQLHIYKLQLSYGVYSNV